ncbi:MAG: preprotein translocase subunit SecG [Treponema sp.]|nr:preprotein translocase subunit SecG [Treponema sp.]MCL2236779.1 preprotein translocase subunit SecG [Treponema sp.]
MGVLSVILLVAFIINAVLLVLLVLIQNDDSGGLGGIFGGGSGSAFGSRSGNVLTRATTVLGSMFLVISFGLALLSRTPGGTGVEDAAREDQRARDVSSWVEDEINPPSNDEFFFDESIFNIVEDAVPVE